MMQSNNQKGKSGIPQPVLKRVGSGGSQKNVDENNPPQISARDKAKVQSSSQHPLAAAMTKKKSTKKNQSSETWVDEKIESQSQKTKSLSQNDSRRRKEDIERQLREAEAQLGAMSDLLEEREKLLEETRNAADDKIEELQDRLMEQEGIMADNGIDPVTGQKVPVSEDDKKKVESTKKITKKTVQAMREKLREMNRQTEVFLADIENTMQYLGSLEESSSNAGPYSEETQAMIARLGADEDAIKRVYDENKIPEGKETKEDSDEDEASDEDGHQEEDDGGQFFITDGAEENVEARHAGSVRSSDSM